MQNITLGRSGLSVSPVAFGTWKLGGDWGNFDRAAAIDAVRRARDLGINFFDTAQAYGFGASEELLGEALRDDLRRNRDDVVIATKGGIQLVDGGLKRDSAPESLREAVDASLRALGVDYIDLYQVHWPDASVPYEVSADALKKLVDAGKIRHVGVSNFDAEQMAAFSKGFPVETLQPPYHLFRRGIEDGVLPYCAQEDIGVLVYSPLGSGLLSGALRSNSDINSDDWRSRSPEFGGDHLEKNLAVSARLDGYARDTLGVTVSQLAIAWVLANPAVHVAILGTANPKHVASAVEATSIHLSKEQLDAIDELMRDAVPVRGATPEGF